MIDFGAPGQHNSIDIGRKYSEAIRQEIGERLRASLRVEPELPPIIRTQIKRLRELEGQSPSIVPTMEHDAGNENPPRKGPKDRVLVGGDEASINADTLVSGNDSTTALDAAEISFRHWDGIAAA